MISHVLPVVIVTEPLQNPASDGKSTILSGVYLSFSPRWKIGQNYDHTKNREEDRDFRNNKEIILVD
jgi:hypothetical protein